MLCPSLAIGEQMATKSQTDHKEDKEGRVTHSARLPCIVGDLFSSGVRVCADLTGTNTDHFQAEMQNMYGEKSDYCNSHAMAYAMQYINWHHFHKESTCSCNNYLH